MASLRRAASPTTVLPGRVVLPVLALWIAFSCTRDFGLTGVPGLPDVTVERVLFLGLLLFAITTFAIRKAGPGSLHGLELMLWIVTLFAGASGVFGGGFASGAESGDVNVLCNALLFPAVAYSIVLRTHITVRDIRRFCAILAVFGAYLGLTALCEKASLTWALVPSSIGDPNVGIHFGRARGPFLQAAFNGTVMVQLLAATVLLRTLSRGPQRVAAAAVITLLCVGAYLTDTRAVLLALTLMALVGACFRWPGSGVYRILAGLSAVGVAVVMFGSLELVPRLKESEPINDRLNLLVATAEMVYAHPLLGVGYGNFGNVMSDYFEFSHFLSIAFSKGFWEGGSHNTLLTALAELGIVFGSLYAGILGFATLGGVRTYLSRRPRLRPDQAGLLLTATLVGLAFLVNAVTVELRYTLTPNALLWVFAALSQRVHLELDRVSITAVPVADLQAQAEAAVFAFGSRPAG